MMDKQLKNIIAFFAVFILSFTLTLQTRNQQQGVGILTPETVPQLNNELHNLKSEIDSLKQQLAELRKRITDYEDAMGKQGNLNELMAIQLLNARTLAGLTEVTGPGIEIVLDDSASEVTEGSDPNMLLVHDEDILTVVSELKAAGAEAIAINGQRLIFNSEIRCGGPTINVNSVRYAPPYIIRAIGNPDALFGYINGPESGYLDLLEYYGLKVEVVKKEKIVIPPYRRELNLRHIKTYKEGE
jgi:uncharacterized protein YlxW (UPF0749 family)